MKTIFFLFFSIMAAAAFHLAGMADRVAGCHTFGQPRVGNAEFARGLDTIYGQRIVRYVHGSDLVCRMPPGESVEGHLTRLQDWWSNALGTNIKDLQGYYEPLGVCVYLTKDTLGKGTSFFFLFFIFYLFIF